MWILRDGGNILELDHYHDGVQAYEYMLKNSDCG